MVRSSEAVPVSRRDRCAGPLGVSVLVCLAADVGGGAVRVDDAGCSILRPLGQSRAMWLGSPHLRHFPAFSQHSPKCLFPQKSHVGIVCPPLAIEVAGGASLLLLFRSLLDRGLL